MASNLAGVAGRLTVRRGGGGSVVLGEDEVATGTAVVKPLRAEVEQQKIAVADLAQAIRPHV